MSTWRKIGLAALLMMPALIVQAQNQAASDYEKAYTNIINEDWKNAEKAMAAVAKRHSQSEFADDAAFWRCYAQSKMERSLENSVVCYEDFIKDYPKSSYVNDAQMNIVTAAQKLTQLGKREYEAILKNYQKDSDMELKLSALHALMNMDDEKATETILELYDSSTDPRLREQMLFTLAESDDPRAQQKLIDIAAKDPEPRMREKAIFWVGDNAETKETVELIYHIALNDTDERVREQAIFALSEVDNNLGMPYLQKIALDHSDPRMREKAVFWIGDTAESQEDIAFLKNIVENDSDQRVQEQAIFALTEADDNMGLPYVREIATTHKEPTMRQKAVFWLGDNAETEEDIKFLENIVNNDPDLKVREHAVFAIAESDELGIESLIHIAKNHPVHSIRKKAIFWLGESDDERAQQVLMDIIQSSN